MLLFVLLFLTSPLSVVHGSLLKSVKNHVKCAWHDLTDTEHHFGGKYPDEYRNRSVDVITQSWRDTLNGNTFDNKKPFAQMVLRDPETILRMAEYQALVYCSSITLIKNMAQKNLRVGSFQIESIGSDSTHHIFWYIASNANQKQLTLVHRGTKTANKADVLDDLDPIRSGARHPNKLHRDFPFLKDDPTLPLVAQGFYIRFKDQKKAIEQAVEAALLKYSDYSFVIVGHSLGAAWAYLSAGYLASKNNIRIAALYTFGQPLLGNGPFVDQLAQEIGIEKIIRIVNKNDLVPHIGCEHCVQPNEPAEKWISLNNQWIDCHGGHDLKCSSGLPCNELSWTEHSSVGKFSMRSEFCLIKANV